MDEATRTPETPPTRKGTTGKRGCLLQALENLFWVFAGCLPLLTLASWLRYGPVVLTLVLSLLLVGLIGMLLRAYRRGNIRGMLRKLAIGLTVYLLIILLLVAYQLYLYFFER
jgi:hypothetical protein